eukprot:290898-Rhodomonas_salina.1
MRVTPHDSARHHMHSTSLSPIILIPHPWHSTHPRPHDSMALLHPPHPPRSRTHFSLHYETFHLSAHLIPRHAWYQHTASSMNPSPILVHLLTPDAPWPTHSQHSCIPA